MNVNVYAAKTNLSRLLDQAACGEEVIITRNGRPVAHARRVRSLPAHHRDPFDRMLVAQALEEGLTVMTRDPAFDDYRVPTAWG